MLYMFVRPIRRRGLPFSGLCMFHGLVPVPVRVFFSFLRIEDTFIEKMSENETYV